MAQLISESITDLTQLGVRAPVIELLAFDTADEFTDKVLMNVLGEMYGDRCKPVPDNLLAELPRRPGPPEISIEDQAHWRGASQVGVQHPDPGGLALTSSEHASAAGPLRLEQSALTGTGCAQASLAV